MNQVKKTAMLVTYPAPRNNAMEMLLNTEMYAAVKDTKNTLTVELEGVAGIGTSAEDATAWALMYSLSDPYDNMYITVEEINTLTERIKQIDGKVLEVHFQEVPVDDNGFTLN